MRVRPSTPIRLPAPASSLAIADRVTIPESYEGTTRRCHKRSLGKSARVRWIGLRCVPHQRRAVPLTYPRVPDSRYAGALDGPLTSLLRGRKMYHVSYPRAKTPPSASGMR
jgi:hypothetical protein